MTLDQYIVKLKNTSDKIVEKVKQAQMDTAFQIQRDMYDMAPVNTGDYRDSIVVFEQKQDGDTVSVEIGTEYKVTTLEGNTYLLGELLESGTRPHDIYAVNKKALSDGVTIFGKHVKHPRYSANASYNTCIK